MAEESVTHRARRVIASRYEDRVPRITINEHDEELMSAIGREWTHNVHRELVPGSIGLNGPCRLQMVAIVAPELTLRATLCDLYANAAASLVGLAVAKQLPQGLATEMGGRV